MTPQRAKTILSSTVKVLVAIALLYVVFGSGKIDLSKLGHLFTLQLGLPLLVLIVFNLYFASERWRVLLSSQGFPSTRTEIVRLTLIGSFFNYAIPGGVGGDVVKGFYFVRNHPSAKVKAAMTILLDRLIGLFSMNLMGLSSLLLYPDLIAERHEMKIILFFLSATFLGFCAAWALIFSRRIYESALNKKLSQILSRSQKLHDLYQVLCEYRHHKGAFIKAVGLSVFTQSLAILFFVLIGNYFNYQFTALNYLFAVPVGYIITAIPVSPAGIGVGQAAFYYLFNVVSGEKTDFGAIAISMVQVMTFGLSLIGAYFYIRMKKPQDKITEIA